MLGNVYDITFRNISVIIPKGLPLPKINLKGADAEHGFWNVRIENFRCNGTEIEPVIISNEFTDITLQKQ